MLVGNMSLGSRQLSKLLEAAYLPMAAFAVQYLGLIAERWYFFAEGRHPQNLHYQAVG